MNLNRHRRVNQPQSSSSPDQESSVNTSPDDSSAAQTLWRKSSETLGHLDSNPSGGLGPEWLQPPLEPPILDINPSGGLGPEWLQPPLEPPILDINPSGGLGPEWLQPPLEPPILNINPPGGLGLLGPFASVATENPTPPPEPEQQQAKLARIVYDQQQQTVGVQYNAQAINIIYANSREDLSNCLKKINQALNTVIQVVEGVHPNGISHQLVDNIGQGFSALLQELEQSRLDTAHSQQQAEEIRKSVMEVGKAVHAQARSERDRAEAAASQPRPDKTAAERHHRNARILFTAAAALALIAVDLMTTGGTISLLALGYSAGMLNIGHPHTARFCPGCGAKLQ